MRIEALEDIKSGGWILTAGDIVTLPDAEGTHFCAHGWARDVSGVVPTGELDVAICIDGFNAPDLRDSHTCARQ